jgi:uncharacterized membrane protein
VLSLYPQYFLPVYILYLIVIFAVTALISYRSNPLLQQRKYISEINSARILFEEKDARKLIEDDKDYLNYMASVASKNLRAFLIMFIYTIFILVFYTFYLVKIIESLSEGYQKFIIYIIYFESLFLINFFVTRKYITFTQFSVIAPIKYKITERGIIGDAGAVLHAKFLLNAQIMTNWEKKYIELDAKNSGYPFKVRLYTDDIEKVKEIIERVKRIEAKRHQTSSS